MRNFQFPPAVAPQWQGKGERGGKNRSIARIVTWCKLKMGKVLGGVAVPIRGGSATPGSG